MREWIKGFLLSSVFVALVAVGGFLLDREGFFNLSQFEVVFVDFPTENEFPAMTNWRDRLKENYSSLDGRSLWSLPIASIHDSILKEGWIADLNIRRRFPKTLSIEIKPKEWIASIHLPSKNEWVGVSSDCELLPTIGVDQFADVPLMIGDQFKKNEELRRIVCSVVNELPVQGLLSRKTISEIRSYEEGELELSLLGSDTKIKINSEHHGLKVQRLLKVMEYLEEKNLTASVISSGFAKKIVVKLRKRR
ncbi:MAG: cell division protein FtsQ/DivIB [Bdellovibrionales bacterium]